jgi:hypothetical protein
MAYLSKLLDAGGPSIGATSRILNYCNQPAKFWKFLIFWQKIVGVDSGGKIPADPSFSLMKLPSTWQRLECRLLEYL